MNKLNWYFHRLQAMSLQEVVYRVSQKYRQYAYKKKFKKPVRITNIKEIDVNLNNSAFNERISNLILINKIENFLKVDFSVFGKQLNLMEEINWHKCTIGTWPSEKYSHDISFKNQDNTGDIRFTWEINRHQFFPYMAIIYKQTKDTIVLKQLKKHFYDWIKANPFLKGVNWSSSMEIAIRAYQWLLVYAILKDDVEEEFLKDLLTASIHSIEYVMNNLSLYSSANNHLILEAAISSIIGYCVEPLYEQNWFEKGYKILEEQIPLQVFEDGVNKEQAVHYHAFVLDMMLQYNFFLRKINKMPLHERYLYNMSVFLGSLALGGEITEIGDSDDAKILNLTNYENYYTYLLQLASVYFKEKFISFSSADPQVKMIAGQLYVDINKEYQYKEFMIFKDGGYAVLNHKNTFLIFDSGPLGFGSIAAHGHADALSIVLYYKQKPIFVDPGTYIYNVEQEWRDYFRKTSSHNTLTHKGLDQSVMKGPFLWSKKTNAKFLDIGENEDLVFMVGAHAGYSPHIHKRAITYLKAYNLTIIADSFSSCAEINYTLNPEAVFKIIDSHHMLIDEQLHVYTSKPFIINEKYVSRSFMVKEKSSGIKIEHDFKEEHIVYTIISDEYVEMKDNVICYKDKKFVYENYNEIRGI